MVKKIINISLKKKKKVCVTRPPARSLALARSVVPPVCGARKSKTRAVAPRQEKKSIFKSTDPSFVLRTLNVLIKSVSQIRKEANYEVICTV